MTREENLHWIDQEIRTWENECQSKHPIKEALYAARRVLEQKPCEDAVSRAEVKKIAKEMYLEVANMELDVKTISDCISYTASKCREVLERKLQVLPPVTPQEQDKPMVEIDLYSVIKQKYIEREVLDKIRAEIEEQVLESLSDGGDDWFTAEKVNECLEIIDRVTSGIGQEPKKGHWIEKWDSDHLVILAYECSECGMMMNVNTFHYCPNCRADMREVKE